MLPVSGATLKTSLSTIKLQGECTLTHNADRSAILSIGERLIQLSPTRKTRVCKQLLGSDYVEVNDGKFTIELRSHEILEIVTALSVADDCSARHEADSPMTYSPEQGRPSPRVSMV